MGHAPSTAEPFEESRNLSEKRTLLGKKGEDLAAWHLQQQGFVILARNYRLKRGEIDIIAPDDLTPPTFLPKPSPPGNRSRSVGQPRNIYSSTTCKTPLPALMSSRSPCQQPEFRKLTISPTLSTSSMTTGEVNFSFFQTSYREDFDYSIFGVTLALCLSLV